MVLVSNNGLTKGLASDLAHDTVESKYWRSEYHFVIDPKTVCLDVVGFLLLFI